MLGLDVYRKTVPETDRTATKGCLSLLGAGTGLYQLKFFR